MALGLACVVLVGCSTPPGSAPAKHQSAKSTKASPAKKDAAPAKRAGATGSSKKHSAAKKGPRTESAETKPKRAPVAKVDRTFLRPAIGPVIARFDGRTNKGIVIAGASGDPVRAAREGRVVFSGLGPRGYGELLMIQHDSTFLTAYAHNSQLLVKDGQLVKKGDVIARMGRTETDRVKLHFELRRNGNAVDPAAYFEP